MVWRGQHLELARKQFAVRGVKICRLRNSCFALAKKWDSKSFVNFEDLPCGLILERVLDVLDIFQHGVIGKVINLAIT